MTGKVLFDHDPVTGIKEWFVPGEGPDDFSIITEHDVTPVLEATKSARSTGKDYWRGNDTFRHEASIPIGVQMEWLTRFGVDVLNPEHMPRVVKLLNDPEWKYLKTAEIVI